MNELEFRKELDNIHETNKKKDQETRIADLRIKYDHKIKLIDEAKLRNGEFNCYQYALNLALNDGLNYFKKRKLKIFPNSEFIQFCIRNRILLNIEEENTKENDIVVYFDSKNVSTHAGKVRNNRIRSKWGVGGYLWEHNIFEVPYSYGEKVKFFKNIKEEKSKKVFKKYALHKGASQSVINFCFKQWKKMKYK